MYDVTYVSDGRGIYDIKGSAKRAENNAAAKKKGDKKSIKQASVYKAGVVFHGVEFEPHKTVKVDEKKNPDMIKKLILMAGAEDAPFEIKEIKKTKAKE